MKNKIFKICASSLLFVSIAYSQEDLLGEATLRSAKRESCIKVRCQANTPTYQSNLYASLYVKNNRPTVDSESLLDHLAAVGEGIVKDDSLVLKLRNFSIQPFFIEKEGINLTTTRFRNVAFWVVTKHDNDFSLGLDYPRANGDTDQISINLSKEFPITKGDKEKEGMINGIAGNSAVKGIINTNYSVFINSKNNACQIVVGAISGCN